MTENPKIALWDMDGTLVNYDKGVSEQMELIRSPEETNYQCSNFKSNWERARIKLIQNQPGFWRNLEPLKQGFDLIGALAHVGFKNHILTKGPYRCENAWTEKFQWCRRYVPGFDVTISQEKSLVYGKILVDDWPPYFIPWLKVRPRGLVIAVAHVYNEGVEHPNLIRYDGTNLEEVCERVAETVAD